MNPALEALRKSMSYRSMEIVGGPWKYFRNPPITKSPIILSTGGLGDALLGMNYAEALEDFIGEKVIIYTRYPALIKSLSSLDVRDEMDFVSVGADWWITINTLVLFNFQNNFSGFKNKKIEQVFLNYRSFLSVGDWDFITNLQPFMENITGIEAVKLGLNRQNLAFSITGVPFRPLKKRLKPGADFVLNDSYITVHNGVDDANDVKERATKNYSLKSWSEAISMIRELVPDIKVIQVGGKNSMSISNVDYNMVGKTSLEEAMQIIARSRLHVDGESGLVHTAHMLGVKSVVMFGPTNMKFFAYDDNVNISPKVCADEGGCWWLRQSWNSKCVLGYVAPLCMDSITPKEVASAVRGALR